MKKFVRLLWGAALSAALLSACGGETAADPTPTATPAPDTQSSAQPSGEVRTADPNKTKIVIGTSSAFEKYFAFLPEKMGEWGYEVEFMIFDDIVTPNIALAEGSVDANFFQHKPYLEAYNKANGTDLYACEPYLLASYYCLISTKYNSLEEIPDGAKIAVSEDASNLSAALSRLDYLGLIELAEIPEDSYYTLFDIAENPHDYEILPMSMSYTVLDDVDMACTHYSGNAADKYGFQVIRLLDDLPVEDFPMVMAVDGKNKDAQWVSDLMEATASDELRAVMDETNTPYVVWKVLF